MTGGVTAATTADVPGPVMRWVLGARPRTLPAALVPVMVGTGAAWGVRWGTRARAHLVGPRVDGWWCALGALVVALAIQVGTNYANDYADGVRGTDDERVGPVRLVASGLARPAEVRRAALGSFGAAGLVGCALAWATSWWIVPVGAACLLAGWFYTGGPRPYGYAGYGELFVFIFFGPVATIGTFYVQTVHLGVGAVWLGAVMVGLLATSLLMANNLRDIASDALSGKRTLAVRIGRRTGGWLYVLCISAPFVGALVWLTVSLSAPPATGFRGAMVLPLLALPLAVPMVRTVLGESDGRALLPVLAGTGRLELAFGSLLAVALLWWLW